MSWWEALIICLVGLWGGTINTVVGSGTLVTFPVLLALGYSPITATTSNIIGLTPGAISGSIGYRHELKGYGRRLIPAVIASFIGAIIGTILLLSLPENAFETIVPVLVGIAVILVILQPKLSTWVANKRERNGSSADGNGPILWSWVFAVGVYGGYFGAAQGIMLMAALGTLVKESLQRLNGAKNVLAAVANTVASVVFAFTAPVDWTVVALLAGSSVVGGVLGARIGRRLSPVVLRTFIVIVGIAAIVQLLLR